MSTDGVSMPTTLSQMGRVAKTQAKGQQQGATVTPYNEREENRDELKLKQVRELEKADQERVEADRHQEKDRRKRRRLARRRKAKDGPVEAPAEGRDPDTAEDADALGVTIDVMA